MTKRRRRKVLARMTTSTQNMTV